MASDITIIEFKPQKHMDSETLSRIKSHAMRKVRQEQAIQDPKRVTTSKMGRTGACLESLDHDVSKMRVAKAQPVANSVPGDQGADARRSAPCQHDEAVNRGPAGTKTDSTRAKAFCRTDVSKWNMLTYLD